VSDENFEMTYEYKDISAKLLDLVEIREQLIKELKIAPPEKILELREGISLCDTTIESAEKYLEVEVELYRKGVKLDEKLEEAARMNALIDEKLPAYVAKHKPEKLEEILAMLEKTKIDKE
jgi:hypothetical protein